ncbi:MAG: LbtU family siderophore porin [Pseudomonadales bacterium]|nr:LbtU family siderophore porin [Pseudomonadales bacterium]
MRKTYKTLATISSLILLAMPVNAVLAEDIEHVALLSDDVLESRIRRLESQLSDKIHNSDDALTDRIVFSGLLEVEAFQTDGPGANFSDINLATVEFAIGAKINQHVDARILLLHEEGEPQDIVVDEGVIDLHFDSVRFSAGRQYLPFGHFDSHFISDPLTLEMAETNDTAITAGYDLAGFYTAAYIFNGDIVEAGETDGIKQYGVQLGYALESESMTVDLGIDYINNLSESDGLSDYFTASAVQENVAGLALHALFRVGGWNVIAEYITATESYDVNDISFKGEGAQPSTYNLELGYSFIVAGKELTLAGGIQGADESLDLGAPEQRYMVGANWAVYKQTYLAVEYLQSEDYGVSDGGTGDTRNTLTFQLAVEF